MPKSTNVSKSPRKEAVTPERIAERAYQIWQSRGGSHGGHEADWYQAERELSGGSGLTILLSEVGKNKIAVIRELRDITGLELDAAKDLAERAPQTVKAVASPDEAEAIRQRLASVGAIVEVR